MTLITTTTHPLVDSAGQPWSGSVRFVSTSRFETGTALVSPFAALIPVVAGHLLLNGTAPDIPPTPDGQGMILVEMPDGLPVGVPRIVTIPTVSTEYADLIEIVPAPGTQYVVTSAALTAAIAAEASRADAAATAAYAPITTRGVLGPRWVFDGDSISSLGSGGEAFHLLADKSGGRIIPVAYTGVPGRATTQALVDFDTVIAPLAGRVDVVCYEEITHSISNGLTIAQFLAQLDAYNAKVKAIGARLVVTSGYPNSTLAATIAVWDRSLITWGKANNVPVIPVYKLANPATGNFPTGWSLDGTHPNNLSGVIEAIADLALAYLDPMLSLPNIIEPAIEGEGLFNNGFLTSIQAAITGGPTAATPSTGAGTLPAGAYDYIFSSWGFQSAPAHTARKVTASYTLGSTGGIAFTLTNTGTFNGIVVYRKGPSDTNYRYLTRVGAVTSWTDDGSLTPTPYVWTDGAQSPFPTGISNGTGTTKPTENAPFVFTEPDIRGNIFRSVANYDVVTLASGLTPGSQVYLSFKFRVHIPASWPDPMTSGIFPRATIRWSGGTTGGTPDPHPDAPVRSDKWMVYSQLLTVPGDRTTLTITTDQSDIYNATNIAGGYYGQYIDLAELVCAVA